MLKYRLKCETLANGNELWRVYRWRGFHWEDAADLLSQHAVGSVVANSQEAAVAYAQAHERALSRERRAARGRIVVSRKSVDILVGEPYAP